MRLLHQHKRAALMKSDLRLLTAHREACDEVWFAAEYGFPTLDTHRQCALQMAGAAQEVRAAGFVASLQISFSLGHGSYLRFLDYEGLTWQRMVGADGGVGPWCSCPRDPVFHAYHDAVVRVYCEWGPASVWIDDDLRMQSHAPVAHCCFCERCLSEFAATSGFKGSREELVKMLNADEGLAIREAWIAFGRMSLSLVATTIARAVHAVAPECRMGLQHTDPAWGGYSGPDWEPVFRALAEASGRPVGSRPGQGFYVDHAPREMLHKALFIGLQNERLPACVDDSRAEVENLPGAVMGKSARGTALEATLALAYGCNGLSFTPLMFEHEEPAWHDRVLAEIAAWRPFWLRYVEANAGCCNSGVGILLDRRQALRKLRANEAPFAWADCSELREALSLAHLGLPLCWSQASPAALLHPSAADGLDKEALRTLLARGVITDGESLWRLEQRGLGHLLGLRTAPVDDSEISLVFTDDPLNGRHAGRVVTPNSSRSAFYAPRSFLSDPPVSGPGVRCLAHHARWCSSTPGESMESVLLPTPCGGRLAVFGTGLWDDTMPTARRAQILAAADWVSHGSLPVILNTPSQITVIPRCNAQGQLRSVLLMNMCLDISPELTLRLRQPTAGRWSWVQPQEEDLPVSMGAEVCLPPLAPWGVGVLMSEEI